MGEIPGWLFLPLRGQRTSKYVGYQIIHPTSPRLALLQMALSHLSNCSIPPLPATDILQAFLHVLFLPQNQASDIRSTVTQLENEVSSSSREAGPSFPCQQSMPGNHDQHKYGLINTISPTPPSFLPSSSSPAPGITSTKTPSI